jgi:HlyD family secretion protein
MKRRRVLAVVAVVAAVSIASFLLVGMERSRDELLFSGAVEATAADLGFNAAGRVEEVAVREGDVVARGQPLAWLDAAELEARASAARAQVSAARAGLAELESGSRREEVSQGRLAVRAAARRLEDAERDLARARRLFDGGAISREALDRAETGHELAGAALDQAREQLGVLETGPRPERIAAQRAAVESAEAMARQADVALENAVIRAPFDGQVTLRHREPGETVQPGLPVVTVMNPSDRWVRIYVPETRLGAIAIGQRAAITSDTFRGKEYPGRVVFVASSAEFTPRNVQTREERVKLVYAVRVEVAGDPGFELKPGMPADVRLLATPAADAGPAPGDGPGR